MQALEKTLKYYELLMTYEDTSNFFKCDLPVGFHYEFYKPGDENEWVDIHISSGEFTSYDKGMEYFHQFYDSFINELNKRLIFIVNNNGEKVGTATISKLLKKEDGYDAAVDWVAIKKEYQGQKLSKPLISKFISLANELGHNKLVLHTQTHTWLAAKLYLDFGFEPYRINDTYEGWQILKTITNHSKLNSIESISNDKMYSKTAILIYDELSKIHGDNFNYEIWYKDGRNDVYVYDFNNYYEYKYCKTDDGIVLEQVNYKKVK